jgi:putative transposase
VLVPGAPAPAQAEDVKESNVSRRWCAEVETPKSGDFGFRADYSMSDVFFKTAPHNPPHLFVADALYMLTGVIYGKVPLMISDQRKAEWRDAFYNAATIYRWQIVAWIVLHNHYHAIVRSPELTESLSKFVNSYHKYIARKWNSEDNLSGRKVWWNYWDTCIRSEHDYYNRLRYVFWNSVKHGLVEKPDDYNFSNYGEYLDTLQNFESMSMLEVNDVPEF